MSRRSPYLDRALLSFAAGVLACGGAGGADKVIGITGGPAATVAATPDLAFTPSNVSVASGATVAWTFGSVAHSVVFERTATTGYDANGYYTGTADAAPSDIATAQGTTVTRRFTTPGTYAYHCLIHANMAGTVSVH